MPWLIFSVFAAVVLKECDVPKWAEKPLKVASLGAEAKYGHLKANKNRTN